MLRCSRCRGTHHASINPCSPTLPARLQIFSPPYLNTGRPRPDIKTAPTSMQPGNVLTVTYTSDDPVEKAFLVRTGATTHSIAFGACHGAAPQPACACLAPCPAASPLPPSAPVPTCCPRPPRP